MRYRIMIAFIFLFFYCLVAIPFFSNSIEVTMKSGQVFDLQWKNSADSVSISLSTKTSGFAKQPGRMVESDAVIGWIDGKGQSILPYYLGNTLVSMIVPSTKFAIQNASVQRENGITTIAFTRLYDTGTTPLKRNENNSILLSAGTDNRLEKHFVDGAIYLNFSANISHGRSASDTQGYLTLIRYAHYLLMLASWAVLFPLGIFAARLSRLVPASKTPVLPFFKIHQYAQCIATLFVLLAIGLVFTIVALHFSTWHHILGVAVAGLCCVQVLFGLLRPEKLEATPTKSRSADSSARELTLTASDVTEPENELVPYAWKRKLRIAWEYGHRIVGGAIFSVANLEVGAWVNLFLGLRAMEFTYATVIFGLHFFVLVVLIGLYFAIEITNCVSPATVLDLLTKSGGAGIGLNFVQANGGELDAEDLFDKLSSDSDGIELDSLDAKPTAKKEIIVNTVETKEKDGKKETKKHQLRTSSDSLSDTETF